jgi:hypothetical protein
LVADTVTVSTSKIRTSENKQKEKEIRSRKGIFIFPTIHSSLKKEKVCAHQQHAWQNS